MAQNDLKQAEVDFEKALSLTQQDGHEELEALALFGLAQVEAKQDNLTLAIQFARKSLLILEKLNHRNSIKVKTFLQKL